MGYFIDPLVEPIPNAEIPTPENPQLPHTAVLSFAAGTGLSQSAPDGGNGPASLSIAFDSQFNFFTSGFFFGGADAFYNIPLAGNVTAGDGDFVQFDMELTIRGGHHVYSGGASETTPVFVYEETFDVHFFNDTPGAFSVLLTDRKPIPEFSDLRDTDAGLHFFDVFGVMTFTAKNDNGPVGITAPQGVTFSSAVSSSAVPEPGSLLTWGLLGGIGLVVGYQRRKRLLVPRA